MTLLVARRVGEGVVLASDSRELRGEQGERTSRSTRKIYEARPGFLFAWAGYTNVHQAFILELQRRQGLSPALDRLGIERHLDDSVAAIRDRGVTDYGEFFLAWWSPIERKTIARRFTTGGTGEYVEDWGEAGDREPIQIARVIHGTLAYIPAAALTVEQAKILTLKVVRDSIAIGGESIGGAVQLGAVGADGVSVAGAPELRVLHDTLDLWEAQSAELLPGGVQVPVDSPTPDRGLRPPG